MAWEATHLLSPIVLVLLASGSWAQDTELRRIVEGRSFSVNCWYGPIYQSKEKVWCQKTSAVICEILVSSLSTDAQQPKYSMWDYPDYHFFTVTMTTVTMRDSGLYICGIVENGRRIITLRNIHLAVSKGNSNISASGTISTWTGTEVPTFNTTKDLNTISARVSIFSIIVPVVCGLFSKTLIFTVLFAVTKRSFG